MSTDPVSEQENLYEILFKVMGSDGDESELINRMKEKESVVISDDVGAFHNAAKAALGNGRRLASCAWHVMSNAKKKRGGWDEKKLFWPYQQARTPLTRDMKWAAMMNKIPPEAAAYLREQKAKEERENANTWTALKHMEAGMYMFDRCGANNPVEQFHAKLVRERGENPVAFLRRWCEDVAELESTFIAAAEQLEKNGDILTPWAKRKLEHSMNEVVKVRLNRGVIINPSEEVSVTEVMGPNRENTRYHVNLEKRTCGCTYWQSVGVACKHAVAVWERYQS